MRLAGEKNRTEISLVQISENYFRGRNHLSMAGILPNLVNKLGLRAIKGDFFGFMKGEELAVRSTEWQEAFDQGRRRHEPRSSGFLLEINKEVLLEWSGKNDLSIMVSLEIERTTDKYKPESSMNWVSRKEEFALYA
jgi:hypothetical protein